MVTNNIEASSQEADIGFGFSQDWPPQRKNLLEILANDRNIHELFNETGGAARLTSSFASIFKRLSEYPSICVLLDFDVVSHFISTPPFDDSQRGLDAIALELFFGSGRLNYALAPGAYRELLNYIRRHIRGKRGRPPTSRQGSFDRLEVIREITRFVLDSDEIDGIGDDDFECLRDDVRRSLLESAHLNVARLLSLLFNKRFQGTRAVFNRREAEGWMGIIQARPRMWSSENVEAILKADSENLAVALSDFLHLAKTGDTRRGDEGYLLLSKTGAIYNLLKNIRKDRNQQEVADQYFENRFLDPRLFHEFPIIAPQKMALLQWFHNVEVPGEASRASHLASAYEVKCSQVSSKLNALISARNLIGEDDLTYDELHRARREAVASAFTDFFKFSSKVRKYEEQRRSLQAVSASYRRFHGESGGFSESRRALRAGEDWAIEAPYGESDMLLADIESALLGQSIAYNTTTKWENSSRILRFSFTDPNDLTILNGSIHFSAKKVFEPISYICTWNITTSELELIEWLTRLTTQNGNSEPANHPAELALIQDGDPCWKHGVVFRTSEGNYGAKVDSERENWKWLAFSNLGIMFDKILGRVPRITDIIINLGYCSVYYEATPRDGERCISFSSSMNLSSEVCWLRYFTTHYRIDYEGLFASVNELLNPIRDRIAAPSVQQD